MNRAIPNMTERYLIVAACRGDDDAFRRLVEPYRAGLRARCYRMLGSVDDGEDALQDALLRAWRGLCGFEGRSSLRNWLYRIATNACLDALERRRERVFSIVDASSAAVNGPYGGSTVARPTWSEYALAERVVDSEDEYAAPAARYEQREAVELAFVASLRHLPPLQRAVLILREAFGLSTDEVAEALRTTTASVNSALQRARSSLEKRPPVISHQATMRSVGDERVCEIAHSFVTAFERGDVGAIVSLLAEEATGPGKAMGAPSERAKAA
jgi:RNA polymerase sigma-70 factor (ECF subfamily)